MDLILDIGGTKIEAVILDSKKVISHKRVLHTHFLEDLKTLLHSFSLSYEIKGVAYSVAGQIKNNKVVKSPNLPVLNNLDLINYTKQFFPKAEIVLANDANCFAYGESLLRKVKEVFIGVVWGTGLGSGIVINNKIVEGNEGIAGELGHVKLNHNYKCGCGKKGCLEAAIGGRYLEERLNKSVKILLSKNYDLFENETLNWLSAGLEKAVHLLNPSHIIFGGSIGENLPSFYLKNLKKKIEENLSFKTSFKLESASSTSNAVIKGCSELLNLQRGEYNE